MDSPVDKPLFYALSLPDSDKPRDPLEGLMIVVIAVAIVGLLVVLGTVLCCVKRQPKQERVGNKQRLRNQDVENGNTQPYPSKLLVNLDPTSSTHESELDSQELPESPVRRPRAFSRASINSRASLGSLGSGVSDQLGRRRSSIRAQVQLEELDLSMYGEARDDELRGVHTILSRGRLCLSVVHDVANDCLVVNVLHAQGLLAETRTSSHKAPGRIDASARVCLLPADTVGHQTAVCRNDADPVWEQSFCFHVTATASALSILKVFIQDHDRFSRKHDLGSVTFHLRELDTMTTPGSVVEIWRDIVPDKLVMPCRGKLFLSLYYDQPASTLTTCIISARDLQVEVPDDEGLNKSSVYTKLCLISEDRVLHRRKTTFARLSQTPSFYDEFNFCVPLAQLDNVTLVCTVYSRNEGGQSKMLGRAAVGPLTYCNSSGVRHWAEMRASQMDEVVMWHTLL